MFLFVCTSEITQATYTFLGINSISRQLTHGADCSKVKVSKNTVSPQITGMERRSEAYMDQKMIITIW